MTSVLDPEGESLPGGTSHVSGSCSFQLAVRIADVRGVHAGHIFAERLRRGASPRVVRLRRVDRRPHGTGIRVSPGPRHECLSVEVRRGKPGKRSNDRGQHAAQYGYRVLHGPRRDLRRRHGPRGTGSAYT